MDQELFTSEVTEKELQDLLALKKTGRYPLIQLKKVSRKAYQLECHDPRCGDYLQDFLRKVLNNDKRKEIYARAFKGYTAHYLKAILEHIEITLRVASK